MRRQGIAKTIEKVFDEMMIVDEGNGVTNQITLEEAMVRASMRRALDPRSKLGMEATRYLTEYAYGKPKQEIQLKSLDYEDMSEDALIQLQYELLKEGFDANTNVTQKDPARFIEEGPRSEIIQAIVDARGERVEEPVESGGQGDSEIEWPADDEELIKGPWDDNQVSLPWKSNPADIERAEDRDSDGRKAADGAFD